MLCQTMAGAAPDTFGQIFALSAIDPGEPLDIRPPRFEGEDAVIEHGLDYEGTR